MATAQNPCYHRVMPDIPRVTPTFVFLHGFASSGASTKGVELAAIFRTLGHTLLTPDLNRPSFAELDHDAMLAEVDRCIAEHDAPGPVRLIGSSLGGWLATRWAQLNPERVDRLVLLCPGFDMPNRWPSMLGADRMKRWQERGFLPFPDATGAPVPVHWGFVEAALRHPAIPIAPCQTLIVHGTQDAVVPLASSQAYADVYPNVSLVTVDDDHGLIASLPTIATATIDFFELKSPPTL